MVQLNLYSKSCRAKIVKLLLLVPANWIVTVSASAPRDVAVGVGEREAARTLARRNVRPRLFDDHLAFLGREDGRHRLENQLRPDEAQAAGW